MTERDLLAGAVAVEPSGLDGATRLTLTGFSAVQALDERGNLLRVIEAQEGVIEVGADVRYIRPIVDPQALARGLLAVSVQGVRHTPDAPLRGMVKSS
ncbi:MAG: hypothetical protein NW206_19640 [Hyphomonadaceae bacterium]|nr:hypothetical protein [Hyphomonadaceae bacterium]